jgi:hypothetical protein
METAPSRSTYDREIVKLQIKTSDERGNSSDLGALMYDKQAPCEGVDSENPVEIKTNP